MFNGFLMTKRNVLANAFGCWLDGWLADWVGGCVVHDGRCILVKSNDKFNEMQIISCFLEVNSIFRFIIL